jgi:hypothetical protein
VVKFKKNNYQDLPWNNTIEEDTLIHLFFSLTLNTKKDIIENYQKRKKFVGTKITPPNINTQKKEFVHSLNY